MSEPTLAEAALQERVRREKARRHLVDFAEYVAPWYHGAGHHRLAAEMLELVETFIRTKGTSGVGRLMIFMPPRHGKSELVSKMFPAWLLGRLADSRVILTSYNADLAGKNSRAARDLVGSERFRNVFGERSTLDQPVALADDSRSVTSWDLAAPHRGGVAAAGVGGGITGLGAHLLVIDDPFKNREEAESQAQRERVMDWYRSSAYTRLEDGGAVVIMHTRWHADDLAGKLLKEMASDPKAAQWVVVNLPALSTDFGNGLNGLDGWEEYHRGQLLQGVWADREDPLGRAAGQALWPAKYNEDDLEAIRAAVGAYDWAALYQQQPYLRSGNLFRREWFPAVELPPASETVVMRVRSWDKAGTASGTGGDYAVGALMSLSRDGVVFVEHVSRGQWTPLQREEEILRCARMDASRPGPATEIWHQQDPGSAGLDSAQATNRALAKAGFTAHFETVSGDKTVRAGPWATACEGGQVRLVRGGWNEAFVDEHAAFPKGPHDDQVDACAFGFAKLSLGGDGWTRWAQEQMGLWEKKEIEPQSR